MLCCFKRPALLLSAMLLFLIGTFLRILYLSVTKSNAGKDRGKYPSSQSEASGHYGGKCIGHIDIAARLLKKRQEHL